MGEMLRDISYPDVHLFEDICEGFKITWWTRDSGCFEKLLSQPSLTVPGVVGMSHGLNQTVISRAAIAEDDALVTAA